jgi:hypothetical protein
VQTLINIVSLFRETKLEKIYHQQSNYVLIHAPCNRFYLWKSSVHSIGRIMYFMKHFKPYIKELYGPIEGGLGTGNLNEQTFIYTFDETSPLYC